MIQFSNAYLQYNKQQSCYGLKNTITMGYGSILLQLGDNVTDDGELKDGGIVLLTGSLRKILQEGKMINAHLPSF